jgi:exodeoxyribonuclease VII large subunit
VLDIPDAESLHTAARRMLQQARAQLNAAARGLPRLEDVLAMPRQRFDACEKRLGRALLANTRAHHTRYARVSGRLRPAPIRHRISLCGERAGALQSRAAQALRNYLAARRRQLDGCGKLIASLSYQSVLRRGFVIVRGADGRTLREAASVQAGDRVELEFPDGRVDAEANSVRLDRAGGDTPSKPAPRPEPEPPAGLRRVRGRSGGSQGSLF